MARFGIVARTALLALALTGVGVPGWAQTGTASLIGEVTDQQKASLPGVTLTLANVQTGVAQTVVSDERGSYRFGGVPPGTYRLRAELSGFKAAVIEGVPLQVDITSRQNVSLELGGVSETVTVTSVTTQLNTMDGSLGNAMSQEQIRSLPIEANNVVHLLSLQPGAVFIPVTNPATADPRYGSVVGARADQGNVTLDGIDVNDPQLQTAYTSAVRMTQESLQEFRVSTSTYNADMGRSSGPQVSLVTRSGTNQYDGSGYWTFRRTKTSTNEYFLELAQEAQGKPSQAPKLDKDILGGSFGGPIRRNRMFFFGNYENLRENSESPSTRGLPSNSFRDGVLIYQCATAGQCPGGTVRGFTGNHSVNPGFYGMTPAEIAGIDPLGIGPNQAAMTNFRQYPSPNAPGLDGRNIMDYTFAAPIENKFNTFVTRIDYKLAESGNHNLFGRLGMQSDEINTAPQFDGGTPLRQRLFNNYGIAIGYDSVLSSTVTNSFRWGKTAIDEENAGLTTSDYNTFRFIAPFDGLGSSFTDTRGTPTQNFVNDLSWLKGAHTIKSGTNIRFTRVPKNRFQSSYDSAVVNPSWVNGVGRRYMPGSAFCTAPGCSLPAVATGGQAGYADAWLNMLGVLSQSTQRVNYNTDGTVQAPGSAVAREIASDEYEFYVQDSWQVRSNLTVTAGVRYSVYSPPYEVNGYQVQPTISMGEWFDQRVENAKNGIPVQPEPAGAVRPVGPEERPAGLLRLGQEQLRAAPGGGVEPDRAGGRLLALVHRRQPARRPRRLHQGVRPRRRRPGHQLRRGVRVRDVDDHQQPVRPGRRDQPQRALPQFDDPAADAAGRAAGRLPADAAGPRRHHHAEHRRHAGDAVGAHAQPGVRARPGPQLRD